MYMYIYNAMYMYSVMCSGALIIGNLLLNFDLMLASSLLILFLSASLDLPVETSHMTITWHMHDDVITDCLAHNMTLCYFFQESSWNCSKYFQVVNCVPAPNQEIPTASLGFKTLPLSLSLSLSLSHLQFLMSEMKTVRPRIASPNFDMMDHFFYSLYVHNVILSKCVHTIIKYMWCVCVSVWVY